MFPDMISPAAKTLRNAPPSTVRTRASAVTRTPRNVNVMPGRMAMP